jgi:hypothetical protein
MSFLDATFSYKWVGQGGLIGWPPGSPDLPPFHFHPWGYIKDKVYVPPLLYYLRKLRERLRDAIMSVDEDTLRRMHDDIAFKGGISRTTRVSHVQSLRTTLERCATVAKKFVLQSVT